MKGYRIENLEFKIKIINTFRINLEVIISNVVSYTPN